MFEVKSMSYEECRAEHFKQLMKKMQRKIDWWQARENKLRPLDMASRSHIECSEAGTQYNFYKDALEALENQPKWISVEDALPGNDASYLVFVSDANRVEIATYFGDGEWLTFDLENLTRFVSHWMPLPQVPEVDV